MMQLGHYLPNQVYKMRSELLMNRARQCNAMMSLIRLITPPGEIAPAWGVFKILRDRAGGELKAMQENQNISRDLYELLQGNSEAYLLLVQHYCPPGEVLFNRQTQLVKTPELSTHREWYYTVPNPMTFRVYGPEDVAPEVTEYRREVRAARIWEYGWQDGAGQRHYWFAYAPEREELYYAMRYNSEIDLRL